MISCAAPRQPRGLRVHLAGARAPAALELDAPIPPAGPCRRPTAATGRSSAAAGARRPGAAPAARRRGCGRTAPGRSGWCVTGPRSACISRNCRWPEARAVRAIAVALTRPRMVDGGVVVRAPDHRVEQRPLGLRQAAAAHVGAPQVGRQQQRLEQARRAERGPAAALVQLAVGVDECERDPALDVPFAIFSRRGHPGAPAGRGRRRRRHDREQRARPGRAGASGVGFELVEPRGEVGDLGLELGHAVGQRRSSPRRRGARRPASAPARGRCGGAAPPASALTSCCQRASRSPGRRSFSRASPRSASRASTSSTAATEANGCSRSVRARSSAEVCGAAQHQHREHALLGHVQRRAPRRAGAGTSATGCAARSRAASSRDGRAVRAPRAASRRRSLTTGSRLVDWLHAARRAFSVSGYASGVVRCFSISEPRIRISTALTSSMGEAYAE